MFLFRYRWRGKCVVQCLHISPPAQDLSRSPPGPALSMFRRFSPPTSRLRKSETPPTLDRSDAREGPSALGGPIF